MALGLATGDRVGLVGPNGSGKSTLLRILAGVEPPDAGEVVRARDARIGWLPQDPDLGAGPARDVVLAGSPRTARAHEAAALLSRLGIPADLDVAAMSQGQRRRVALATTLLAPADLLLLDEPTNHLDVWTVDWLEEELARRVAGLVVVTHDRRMLEALTDQILEVDPRGLDPTGASATASAVGGGVFRHDGGYSTVLVARAERDRRRDAAGRRRRNVLRKEIAWLRRAPKARGSKPRFRVEQARALDAAAPAGEPGQLQLGTGRRRLGTQVVDVEGAEVGYGDDPPVLDDVEVHLGPGDRVGVVGPNGAGKTTLLRVLLGELTPRRGSVRHGPTVELGVYRQDASVDATGETVLETLLDVAEHVPLATGETLPASRLAERFGFDARLQRTAVDDLSGGERRRLALLHLLVDAPNVIVLDEPTNDLDLETLATLEDHLDGFAGTLVVASHDRFVLDRLTDRLLAVGPDGRVTRHLDWASYREAVDAAARAAEAAGAPAAAPEEDAGAARAHQEQRREARALEQRMERLARLRDELDAGLVAAGADHETVRELATARAAVTAELTEVEDAWLAATT